jgi:hypothetical protein
MSKALREGGNERRRKWSPPIDRIIMSIMTKQIMSPRIIIGHHIIPNPDPFHHIISASV